MILNLNPSRHLVLVISEFEKYFSLLSIALTRNSEVLINVSEPFMPGKQPGDVRISVTEEVIDAPDYTEGETSWSQSRLIIENINRSDDGLYECQAVNIGGKFLKSGHISVEFAPTFEDQVITEEWSWDQRATNLSCLGKKFHLYFGNDEILILFLPNITTTIGHLVKLI